MNKLDFQGLNERLLSNAMDLLPSWLPGGKLMGREYKCSDLQGGSGTSLSVNIDTGKWADFASHHKGGDLISLYAAINNLDNGEAFKRLNGQALTINQRRPNGDASGGHGFKPLKPPPHSKPSGVGKNLYEYTDIDGDLLFCVQRIDRGDGKKWFCPWSFSNEGWVKKAWPSNRPLYNLKDIHKTTKKVLIVEGEKAALAAIKHLGDKYHVITWSSGSKAISKTDWSPIFKRPITIWPDSDEPGISAATEIANHLEDNNTHDITILRVDDIKIPGYDAADFFEDHTAADFFKWAKPRATKYNTTKYRPTKNEVPVSRVERIPEPEPPHPEPPYTEPPPHIMETIPDEVMEAAEQAMDRLPAQGSVPAHMQERYSACEMVLNRSQRPYTSAANVYQVLLNYMPLKDLVFFDVFTNNKLTKWKSPDKSWQVWDEDMTKDLLIALQTHFEWHTLSKTAVQDALDSYAKAHTINISHEWLNSLPEWDGKGRINFMLRDYFGVVESEYTLAVSTNVMIMIVARLMEPGCKVDNMLILEGAQGTGKSTALSILGGDWFRVINQSLGSDEFYRSLRGISIGEIAELDALYKSDQNSIKTALSTQKDSFRDLYSNVVKDRPRTCVLIGTTNDTGYLKDPTGARRFWPVIVKDINLEALKRDRDQLYAEALHRYKAGEQWHEVPASAQDEQSARKQDEDVWTPDVMEFLFKTYDLKYTWTTKILDEALELDINRREQRHSNRVCAILKSAGWVRGDKTIRHNGKPITPWYPPEGFYSQQTEPSFAHASQPQRPNIPNLAPQT